MTNFLFTGLLTNDTNIIMTGGEVNDKIIRLVTVRSGLHRSLFSQWVLLLMNEP